MPVPIGNIHPQYYREPQLDFEVLSKMAQELHISLV